MAGSDAGNELSSPPAHADSAASVAGSNDDFHDTEAAPETLNDGTQHPDHDHDGARPQLDPAAEPRGADLASSSSPPSSAIPPGPAASTSSLRLPPGDSTADLEEPDASSPDELVAFLRGQITDLTGQVTSLNSKLVKSYTTRGELEDDLHDNEEAVRGLRQRVAQLEQDKVKWDKEIEAGGWVEKNHVQGEMQRLMTKVMEETKNRETAVQAQTALETEIESLTSNLFTEANKMVAFERVARARAEEKMRSFEQADASMQALLDEVQVSLRETVLKLEKRDAEVVELKQRLAAHGEAVEEDPSEGLEPGEGDVGAIMFSDGEHLSPLNTKALAVSTAQPSPSGLSAPRLLTSVLPYHEFLSFITYLRQTRVTALTRPVDASFSHPGLAARAFAADPPPQVQLSPAQLLSPHLLLSTHLSQPFLKRCVEEDSDPALRLDLAPGLGFLSRRGIGQAIVDGTLLIEPLHAGIDLQSDKCALCGCSLEKWLPNSGVVRGFKPQQVVPSVASVNQTMRKFGSSLFSRSTSSSNTPTFSSATSTSSSYHNHHSSSSTDSFVFPPPAASASHHPHDALLLVHLFRASDTATQRYPVCPSYCLARLRAVCEFWTYIRVIERGLLLEEGFRFGQGARDGASSEPQTPVRSTSASKPATPKVTTTATAAQEGLGLGPVGAHEHEREPELGIEAQAGDVSVQARDFEAEDTHDASDKGTPRIVEPEGGDLGGGSSSSMGVGAEGEDGSAGASPALTANSNDSSSSLSAGTSKGAAAPPRPSRSSARNSPTVSRPSSPPAAPRTPPPPPPRRAGADSAQPTPPPRHPSLAGAAAQGQVVPGGDIVASATGWEDRCWSEVVRLKESVFWTRVAAVAPDGGEVSGRGARVWQL
ncbi:hypothetical protein JCM9279_001514 [Rhodotorula babjevae]